MKIELKALQDAKKALADFLKEKMNIEFKEQEDEIIIDTEIGMDQLKTYIKKFLYREGLRERYKIRVNKGTLSFKETKS
ncbi:MAG: hypothetical protein QXX95_04080 [Nitrososphaerales archaeon]